MEILFDNGSTVKSCATDHTTVRSSDKTYPVLRRYYQQRCNDEYDEIHKLINETIKGEIYMKNTYAESLTTAYEALATSANKPFNVSQTTSNDTPKTIKILNLWRDKQFSLMSDQYNAVSDSLYKEDSLYKSLYDLAIQMATQIAKEDSSVIEKQYKTFDRVATVILGNVGENFTLHTKETMYKVDTEIQKYIAAKENVNSSYDEIKTMLSACDTYRQEMEVLRSYNIVDANGKLNVSTVESKNIAFA